MARLDESSKELAPPVLAFRSVPETDSLSDRRSEVEIELAITEALGKNLQQPVHLVSHVLGGAQSFKVVAKVRCPEPNRNSQVATRPTQHCRNMEDPLFAPQFSKATLQRTMQWQVE